MPSLQYQDKKKALLLSWDFKSLPEHVFVFSSIRTGNVKRLVSPFVFIGRQNIAKNSFIL